MSELTSHHDLIFASRVTGTAILNTAGDRIGHVEDLSIHKRSGEVIYAILSFGGFLGIGERWHPVPWALLEYDPAKAGYVLPLDKADLAKAPSLSREDLEELGAGEHWRDQLFDYYGRYGVVPYII